MTTLVDYQYSVPEAYQFPARRTHIPSSAAPFTQTSSMVKHHPQPLNLQNTMARTSPYIQSTGTVPVQVRQTQYPQANSVPYQHPPTNRRTNSQSTGVSGTSLYRSTSNASSGSGNAYVTRLRKQKATVWCDRSQREDARLLAAQKAAKARAAMEVAKAAAQAGSHFGNGASNSSVHRVKIRHHGSGGRKGNSLDHEFSTNRSLVAGVPARLDIEDDSSDDDQPGSGAGSAYGGVSRRTGSGRSSINSAGRRYGAVPHLQLQVQNPSLTGAATNTSSPSTYSRTSSLMEATLPEVPEIIDTPGTIVPSMRSPSRQEYFPTHKAAQERPLTNPTQNFGKLQSPQPTDSYSSSSSGDSRPELARAKSSREPGDIKRRGSIEDDRTMTMGRVRLFVANPDQ